MKKGKPALLPQIVLLCIIQYKPGLICIDCSRQVNLINWLWKFLEPVVLLFFWIQFYLTNLNWINRNLKFICYAFEVCIKISKAQTRVENYFSFQFFTLNRGGWNVREKRWGKQSYLATSREDMREARTIQPWCFTDSLSSLFNRPIVLTQSSLPSFLSILAQFPKPKL